MENEKKEKRDYAKDMRIDETALDVEWLEQAELAVRYGRAWARKKKLLALAYENIKLVRSRLIQEANDDPDYYLGKGIKPTAPVVEAYYRNHPDHIQAKKEWIEMQFETDLAEIIKSEISFARKAALENLVKLHQQQYFAGPSIQRDLSFERSQKERVLNSKIAGKLTRRTKDGE